MARVRSERGSGTLAPAVLPHTPAGRDRTPPQLFSDRTHGLHINGEDTRIGQMKIEMDLNQML